ncbi:MAG TPA: PLP-dependent aspartate aminotransferase family protein [Gemmatimonadaceae bacterium]|nr:PLP-dependent aspartate aminotransferase family protein [Gemmatimonadaceae bacterium]
MPSRTTPLGLSTTAIHGGCEEPRAGRPVVSPIYQSVNFLQQAGTEEGLGYLRYGNNPNAELLHRRLALLEGTEAALVLASGMGATTGAMLALLRPGDHLLASSWLYGGTHRFFTTELKTMGIDVTLVEPTQTRMWRRHVQPNTRAIFVETPVNPSCRVLDLEPLSHLAREAGLALVVDSTFASPVNFRPVEYGADIVIHSATKYLNGHHDVLAGVVLGTASFIEEVRQKMMVWGQAPDPFALWLLERGLKTLDVRVQRQNENAMRLAEWAEHRSDIARVHYPGLASHPDHASAKATMRGYGGMMALELSGGGAAAERFIQRLRIIAHAPSLGGVDSLVCEPRFTSHSAMTSEERAAIGIPDGFVRLSVGIENADDLIADMEQALGS